MTSATQTTATQIYQVFIKASPEQIWEAITTPEFTARYFHSARIENSPQRHHSLGHERRGAGGDDRARRLWCSATRRSARGWPATSFGPMTVAVVVVVPE